MKIFKILFGILGLLLLIGCQPQRTLTSSSSLNKYVEIVIGNSLNNTINHSILKVKYSDKEVLSANLQEGSMRLYRWNGSNWDKFDGAGSGIDTVNNIIFANTTQFSTWGIFGNSVPEPAPSGGGVASSGGGGGRVFDGYWLERY